MSETVWIVLSPSNLVLGVFDSEEAVVAEIEEKYNPDTHSYAPYEVQSNG